MEGLPRDPDNIRLHKFVTARVREMVRLLVEVEQDDFVQTMPNVNPSNVPEADR
jgi:hypothetical protein